MTPLFRIIQTRHSFIRKEGFPPCGQISPGPVRPGDQVLEGTGEQGWQPNCSLLM